MALGLGVATNSDDYLLVEHAGERIRIGVHQGRRSKKVTIILLADDDTGKAPDRGWRIARRDVRERADGHDA